MHFLTLVSVGPRTKNQLCAIWIWFVKRSNGQWTMTQIQIRVTHIYIYRYKLHTNTNTTYTRIQTQLTYKYKYKLHTYTSTNYTQIQMQLTHKYKYELLTKTNTRTNYTKVPFQIILRYKHKYKLLRILFHWISAGGSGGIALVGMSAVNTTVPRAWIVLSLRLLATLFVKRNKNTNKIQKYKHNSATDRYCWDLTDVTLFAKLQCYHLLILFVDE